MPVYDYRCPKKCGEFETFHSMMENPVIRCPQCGKAAVKLISKNVTIGRVFHGYFDKGEGKFFAGHRAMKEHAKATGQVFGSNEELFAESAKVRKERDEREEKALDSYLDRESHRIASIKKRR